MQTLRMLVAMLGACLGVLAAAAAATGFNTAQQGLSNMLPSHHRQKRAWIWNQMHIDEEKNSSLPHYVGKILSSVNRKNAKYLLRGDAAGKVFQVSADSGMVYAFERLDREKIAQYHLTAFIVDKDTNKDLEPPSNFTIKVDDVNDHWPVFAQRLFNASVPEMSPSGTLVTRVTAVDADDPTVVEHTLVMYQIIKGDDKFSIDDSGNIFTKVSNLDREKQARYEIVVGTQDALGLRGDSGTATVLIMLQDVNDNFPIFTKSMYNFAVPEDIRVGSALGSLFVEDPDEPQNRKTKYSIVQGEYRSTFTIEMDPKRNEGIIKPMKPLDYERIRQYSFTVEATDPTINLRYLGSSPIRNIARVVINVTDVDEPPVFQRPFYYFQLVMQISAIDKDITPPGVKFRFSLGVEDSNFTLTDNHNNTANIIVKYGQFDRERAKVHNLPVIISDNGWPSLTSTNMLAVEVCKCNEYGEFTYCEEVAAQAGVSIQALVAIFLCILTILVITLLIFLRRRLQKQARAHGKSVPEIHEQLVSYDEEGGGEMDTTSYDVSVLNSARRGAGAPRSPEARPPLYAQVQKQARRGPGMHRAPGEMAAVIEEKKDEADRDGAGPPYDTLHIYGFEGSESIAESLSTLSTDSSSSDVDYDFLNDWGPRFKMLAELYGSDPREVLY
ncbi:PREDICTED: cadherin-5-like [Elephantulus edwardii]|uniref:cadherin-5-like n=1 Tax=Elephantulus edwardii TaxID=28737 RepID=UPI0003F0A1BB|nr:PREDICTED: cadherin-5-like [Elephantulus edwardii]